MIQLSQLPQLSGWKMTTSGSTKETCWFLRHFKRPSLHYHPCRLSENMWKLRSTKLGLIKVPEFLQQEMNDANVPPEPQPLSLQVSRTHSPRVGLLLEIGLDIRDRTSKEQVQLLHCIQKAPKNSSIPPNQAKYRKSHGHNLRHIDQDASVAQMDLLAWTWGWNKVNKCSKVKFHTIHL